MTIRKLIIDCMKKAGWWMVEIQKLRSEDNNKNKYGGVAESVKQQ